MIAVSGIKGITGLLCDKEKWNCESFALSPVVVFEGESILLGMLSNKDKDRGNSSCLLLKAGEYLGIDALLLAIHGGSDRID
jgi:hypothetical protein